MNKNESNNRLQMSEKQKKKAKDKIANMALSAKKTSSTFRQPDNGKSVKSFAEDNTHKKSDTNHINLDNSAKDYSIEYNNIYLNSSADYNNPVNDFSGENISDTHPAPASENYNNANSQNKTSLPQKTVTAKKATATKPKTKTSKTQPQPAKYAKSNSNLSDEELLQQRYARIKRRKKIHLIGNIIVSVAFILLIILGIDILRQRSELASKAKATESLEAEVASQQDYISELNDTITLLQETTAQTPTISMDSTYASLYPDLIAKEATSVAEETHKVYLTFDDGPSDFTPQILDILDQYGIKATFFVVHKPGDKFKQYYKDIVDRGHTIGIHSYTHEYENIYASVESFLDDFQKMYNFILETTDVSCSLFRFPGGSKNSFDKDIYLDLINEMERRGFIYYDWNVSSGDAASKVSTEAIINNVCSNVPKKVNSVVLMHDANNKATTVEALPTIIQTLQNQGYTFDKLSYDMTPVQYPR